MASPKEQIEDEGFQEFLQQFLSEVQEYERRTKKSDPMDKNDSRPRFTPRQPKVLRSVEIQTSDITMDKIIISRYKVRERERDWVSVFFRKRVAQMSARCCIC